MSCLAMRPVNRAYQDAAVRRDSAGRYRPHRHGARGPGPQGDGRLPRWAVMAGDYIVPADSSVGFVVTESSKRWGLVRWLFPPPNRVQQEYQAEARESGTREPYRPAGSAAEVAQRRLVPATRSTKATQGPTG
jgi:hypothetical protein